MTQRFRGVLLDLDGLLIASEKVMWHAGIIVLSRRGVPAPEAFVAKLVGHDDAAGRAALRAQLGPDADLDALNAEWSEIVQGIYQKDGIDQRPGAKALLTSLAAQGVPHALVTSSYRTRAKRKLRFARLDGLIADMVCRDDVQHGKPAPEPYLRGAELLGLPPGDCVAFEDSNPGVQSARDAGCVVVQVPDMVTPEPGLAHHIAADLWAAAAWAGLGDLDTASAPA